MAGLCGNRTEKKNKNNEKSTPADENPMRSALDELVRTVMHDFCYGKYIILLCKNIWKL